MSRQADSPTTIRLSPELIELIDAARGDVPRQRWVVRAIERQLAGAPDRASRPAVSPRVPLAKFKPPTYR